MYGTWCGEVLNVAEVGEMEGLWERCFRGCWTSCESFMEVSWRCCLVLRGVVKRTFAGVGGRAICRGERRQLNMGQTQKNNKTKSRRDNSQV